MRPDPGHHIDQRRRRSMSLTPSSLPDKTIFRPAAENPGRLLEDEVEWGPYDAADGNPDMPMQRSRHGSTDEEARPRRGLKPCARPPLSPTGRDGASSTRDPGRGFERLILGTDGPASATRRGALPPPPRRTRHGPDDRPGTFPYPPPQPGRPRERNAPEERSASEKRSAPEERRAPGHGPARAAPDPRPPPFPFPSTSSSHPKIYFLPVHPSLAAQRLSALERATSRDWDARRDHCRHYYRHRHGHGHGHRHGHTRFEVGRDGGRGGRQLPGRAGWRTERGVETRASTDSSGRDVLRRFTFEDDTGGSRVVDGGPEWGA